MKRSIFYLSFFAVLAFVLLTSEECAFEPSQRQKDAQKVEQNVKALSNQTELPMLTKSLERINIKKRLELFEDENKVSYIYLINYGKVMAFYTVKGKVTSGNKRLTQTLVSTYETSNSVVLDSPELDGTYGTSAPYIFFWTTDGTYVQWSSDYMLCDKPLKMATQPELYREVN